MMINSQNKIKVMKKFDRVDVLSYISDLYKDVNGVRPRFYNFNEWSDAE